MKITSEKHESVRFLEQSLITIYDSEKNIIKCGKCEKKATGAAMGHNAYIAYCEDHLPWVNEGETKRNND